MDIKEIQLSIYGQHLYLIDWQRGTFKTFKREGGGGEGGEGERGGERGRNIHQNSLDVQGNNWNWN